MSVQSDLSCKQSDMFKGRILKFGVHTTCGKPGKRIVGSPVMKISWNLKD